MSLKELAELTKLNTEISKLSKQLEELESKEGVDKEEIENLKKELIRKQKDAEVLEILSFIPDKGKQSEEENKIVRDEVSEIIDSFPGKREKQVEKEEHKENHAEHQIRHSKPKRYTATNAMKKMQALMANLTKHISELKNRITINLRNKPKNLTAYDKMKGIIDLQRKPKNVKQKTNVMRTIKNGIKSLTYKPQHAMPNRYVAKGKEMVGKIRFLASNAGKTIVTKASTARKNIATHMENARRLRNEAKRENKVTIRKPKTNKLERYTAPKGTKRKMMRIKMYIATGVAALGIWGSITAVAARDTEVNNNMYGESVRITSEVLEEMQNNSKLEQEENSNTDKQLEDNNSKLEKEINEYNINSVSAKVENTQNTAIKYETISENDNELPKEDNIEDNVELLNEEKIEDNVELYNEENTEDDAELHNESETEKDNELNNEIKKIYGGEISASENGIRTEEDILYAATQMNWSQDRIENIKEMMPGLLAMQKDFDLDPLCALAVFQWESGCGTQYEPGGKAYERENDFRLANTHQYKGQDGVMGLSRLGYTYYDSWSTAAYEFGKYVRNGLPYAESEKGAQTMADLENFGPYTGIFGGAATNDAATYNKLKQCLELKYSKNITIDDISKAVEGCTTSEIKEMTASIKSNIDKEKSVNQQMAER